MLREKIRFFCRFALLMRLCRMGRALSAIPPYAAVDTAMLGRPLHTVFGWRVHVGENSNPRALRNFPMQANGAEMLRIACCLTTERGIEVCAPVHDAVLI